MVKKLLLYKILSIGAFLLWGVQGIYAQCPTAVNIAASPSGAVCSGTDITFTANVTGEAPYTFQWEVDGTPVGNEQIYSSASLSNGNVLKVTVTSGNEICTESITDSHPVTINPNLTASVEIQANSQNICPGETVNFTIKSSSNLGGSANYSWNRTRGGTTSVVNGTNAYSTDDFQDGDEVFLAVQSSVPCVVNPVTSNPIAISVKEGAPSGPGSISFSNETAYHDGKFCPGSTATFSVSGITGANSYLWTLPGGWSGETTGSSVNVTIGSNLGNQTITVEAISDCGSIEQTLQVEVGPGKPGMPADISMEGNLLCENTTATFRITGDSALVYTWAVPAGWEITSGQGGTEIQVTVGDFNESGAVSVYASNACSDSDLRSKTFTINEPIPATPGTIGGPLLICPDSENIYSISAVPYADKYSWTWEGGTIETTVPQVSLNAGEPGTKNLVVVAENECGTSAASTLGNIVVDNGKPAGIIISQVNGNNEFCPSEVGLVFSVPADEKVDTWTWTVPSGWNITAGAGTTSITVTAGQLGEDGMIGVTGKSEVCGEERAEYEVHVKNPAPKTDGMSIDGPIEVCHDGSGIVYTIPEVEFATDYTWDVPDGWSFTQNKNTITVSAGNQDGDITVVASNECGSSGAALALAVSSVDGIPETSLGTITAESGLLFCPPATNVRFSIPHNPSVATQGYKWDFPNGWDLVSETIETVDGNQKVVATFKINSNVSYTSSETVSVSAVNLCGVGTKSTTSQMTFSNFVETNAGEDVIICRTNTAGIQLNGSVKFGSANPNSLGPFIWSVLPTGAGSFSDPKTINPKFTPNSAFIQNAENTEIQLILKTSKAPNGACKVGEDELIIFILNDPSVEVSAPTEICHNSATEITFSNGPPNGIVKLSNETSVNLDASGAGVFSTGNLTATTTYQIESVEYGDGPACPKTLNQSVIITVNEPPVADFSYATLAFCSSDTNTYGATGSFEEGEFSSMTVTINPETGEFSPSGMDPGIYTITYTLDDPLDCGFESKSIDIEIFDSVEITTQPVATRLCQGSPLSLSVVASGDVNGYQWYKDGTAISGATAATYTASAAEENQGMYHIEVIGEGPCEALASEEITVTIDEPIVISTQPLAATTCNGGDATFTVAASAGEETLNYEWYKDGSPIADSNSATLNVTAADADATYKVLISGGSEFLCSSLESVEVSLNVRPTPEATIAVTAGSETICSGEGAGISFTGTPNAVVTYTDPSDVTHTVTLDASGTYQLDTAALTVSGEIAESFSFGLVSVAYVDETACEKAVSGTAEITVNPLPTVEFSEENTLAFCNESGVTNYTPVITGTGLYEGGEFTSSGLTVNSETGEFSTEGVAPGTYTITYSVDADGDGAGCDAVSADMEITVYQALAITSQPFNVAACTANPAQLEVAASGDALSYQWFKEAGTTDIEVGGNSPILELSNVTIENDGTYYVVVSSDFACSEQISQSVTLNVDENIVITQQPESRNACVGSTVELNVLATASGASDVQYQWMRRLAGGDWEEISGEINSTLNLASVDLSDSAEYRAEIDGPEGYSCNRGYSEIATVTVYENPTAEAGDNFEVCSTEMEIPMGTGASAGAGLDLVWNVTNEEGNAGSGTINNANTLAATYTPGLGDIGETLTFTLTATLIVDGVEMCAGGVSDFKTVKIVPQPSVTEFYYGDDSEAVTVEFCETDRAPKLPTMVGEHLGTGTFNFSVSEGLQIDPQTGKLTIPEGITVGTYTITYTHSPASSTAGCGELVKTFIINIGKQPDAGFSYESIAFCKDTRATDPQLVNVFEVVEEGHEAADSFTATGERDLIIDSETGQINITQSEAGFYEITRTIDYTGTSEAGCEPETAKFSITISDMPIADFAYEASEYCSDPAIPITITPILGTNAHHGEYSFTTVTEGASLVLDSNTGEIDIAGSDEGSYIVTNTISNGGGEDPCMQINFSSEVIITKLLDPTFNYTTNSLCISAGHALVEEGFVPGGEFKTDSEGVSVDIATGVVSWSSIDPKAVGPHIITYTLPTDGPCAEISASTTITIDALPVGGELNFGTNGRIFMTCENAVAGYGEQLKLTGYHGQIVEWQYRSSETLEWSTYTSLEEGYLSSDEVEELVNGDSPAPLFSTVFRVKIKNGACDTGVFSKTAILNVIPTNIEPAPVQVTPDVLCYGEEISLSSETGYGAEFGQFDNGAFDNAGIKNSGWGFTNPDGTKNDFSTKASNGRADHWLRMVPHGNEANPNPKVYTANIDNPAEGTFVNWDPSLGTEGNEGFALVTGDNDSYMETPVFSLDGLDVAVLTWDQGYNLTDGARIRVEISTNGGQSYDTIPLFEVFGKSTNGIDYYDEFGDGTPETRPLNKMVIDLGDYMGHTALRVRFNYEGAFDGDVWAVDEIKVPDGPVGVKLDWYYDDDINDPNNELEQIGITNQEQVTFMPRKIGWNDFEVKTALLLDSKGNACESLENSKTVQVFVFDQYTTSVDIDLGSCGDFTAEMVASVNGDFQGPISNYPTLDGYVGQWNIVAPDGATYTLSNGDVSSELDPIEDPYAVLESEAIGEFVVTWELVPTASFPENFYDVEKSGLPVENPGCLPNMLEATVTIEHCSTLDFDGVDDYVDIGNTYSSPVAIEAWIRPFDRAIEDDGNTDALTGTIISGDGFEINMADLAGEVEKNGRWFHIAVSNGVLYVDGVESGSFILDGNFEKSLIGARWNSITQEPENFFSGWIEEVRIWNKSLSENEIRFMMNQRIDLLTSTHINGEVVPVKESNSYKIDGDGYNLWEDEEPWFKRSWGDLDAYFRLISADPDPIIGYLSFDETQKPAEGMTPNFADPANPGRLHNMETDQENTSPTPYISYENSTSIESLPWADKETWLRPLVWDYPNSVAKDSKPILWNIALTRDNIHSGDKDITLLGLLVEKEELTIKDPSNPIPHWLNEGQELRVTHYLKLNGVIDMYGSSQLLQNPGSIVDSNSSGWMEIDQQGTANSYNYNYWTSPVSMGPRIGGGSTSEHVPHMLRPILKDGTGEIFQEIDFNYSDVYADGALASPIKISSFWLYKFHGSPNVYGQWRYIGPGIEGNLLSYLKVGEGWSMKGTSGQMAIEDRQNYTFKGMPNNGYFTLPIGANENYLIGNPFPSALDADKFINDNLDVIDGTLYFWSHFAGGDTHILKQYEGGYALYNLSGGTEPFADDERIDNTGNMGALKPGQFVPIGQAFFVRTDNPAASVVTFKNSQRQFQREADLISVFLHQEKKVKVEKQTETRERIWFRFRSPDGYQRQFLVTADENTTDGFDRGYDARLIENNKDDMYWVAGENKFVIQGIPHLQPDRVLKLGVNTNKEGWISISIDELQNIANNKEIFLKDNQTQLVHNLRESPYVVYYSGGKDENRFEIVFRDEFAQVQEPVSPDIGVSILYLNGTREFVISNPHVVELYDGILNNVIGQQVQVFGNIPDQEEARLEVERFSPGVYFVKVRTAKGMLTEKIIIEE